MFSLARTQENLQMHLPQRRYGLANCATTTLYELECMMVFLYISGSQTIDPLGSNVGDLITIVLSIRSHL